MLILFTDNPLVNGVFFSSILKCMLQLITDRLEKHRCDEVMETAWSTLWNVTGWWLPRPPSLTPFPILVLTHSLYLVPSAPVPCTPCLSVCRAVCLSVWLSGCLSVCLH